VKHFNFVQILCAENQCLLLLLVSSSLGVFKCQYTGAFLLVSAVDLFGSFCATCNEVACGVITFGDSIILYSFAADVDKCL